MHNFLLFGYGNPGRGDDALGPLLIEKISACNLPHMTELTDMQLLIEHAADLTGYSQVVFADADMSCMEPFEFSSITAEKDGSYTSHALSPSALLYVFQQIYQQPAPVAFLLRIRGYRFELGSGLTTRARLNLQAAATKIQQWYLQNT